MIKFLNKLLEKHKLQEYLEWQIGKSKKNTINILRTLTRENYYSVVFSIFDMTTAKEKKFIGTITDHGFVLRKRMGPFDFFPIMVKVNGEFKVFEGQTTLAAKINGMRPILVAVRLLMLVFLGLSIILVIITSFLVPIGEVNPFSSIFSLLFLALIFIVVPYFIARKNMNIMKTELNEIFGPAKQRTPKTTLKTT